MKKINKEATKTLEKIARGLKVGERTIVDNTKGAFMPVHIEVIGRVEGVPGTGRLISIAHYYEQNGDLVTDPEMVFIESKEANGEIAYYPVSWEMGGIKYERSVDIDEGRISGVRPKLQRQHAIFAGKWLDNIKSQQRL